VDAIRAHRRHRHERGAAPSRDLASFRGILQADGYAGFERLYEHDRIREAACWA
jgi:hypothetical protein